ncbi:MAG: hypothetical protein ABFE07_09735 [Armatimonadia bacterium]
MSDYPKVRVADEPSANAPTYGEVIKDALRASNPWVDNSTPDGHFGVAVKNIGGHCSYWFRGELGDPDARVVARTQNGEHYLGGGLLGGQWVGRIHTAGGSRHA